MTPGTPDGSAFGFPDVELPEPENDPLSDEFVEEPVEAAPQSPEPDFDDQDEEYNREFEEAAAPEPEPQPQPEPAPVPEPQLFAGRYQSTEALEKGYQDLQAAYTRDHQERLALEQRQQQVEEILAGLTPILEQQLAQSDPEALERYKQQQAVAEQAQRIAEEQVAPLREQLEIQAQNAQVENLVRTFRTRHPDVQPGTTEDAMVAQTAQDLGLNAANLDALEVAYEASKDLYFKQVLRANPAFVDSPEGIAYARIQARMLESLAGAARPTPPQQPQTQTSAYVETGEGGAPAKRAASTNEFDEFDEAMGAWERERRSPLFGSRPS